MTGNNFCNFFTVAHPTVAASHHAYTCPSMYEIASLSSQELARQDILVTAANVCAIVVPSPSSKGVADPNFLSFRRFVGFVSEM